MRAPAIRAVGFLSGAEVDSGAGADPALRSLGHPAPGAERLRRASRECLLALAAVEAMLEDAGVDRAAIAGDRTALVYATAACYAASNRSFIEGGGTLHFALTAPAVVPAQVSIEFAVTGPYAILIGGPPATLRAIWHAADLLERGVADRALVLTAETFEECADLHARARRLVGRPLVEAAGCLWLEPGDGELILASRRRARGAGRRPAGAEEMFGCAPLRGISRWRRRGRDEPLELSGTWRGEEATLTWRAHPAIEVGGRRSA